MSGPQAANAVSFEADVLDDAHYEFTIASTGRDTGDLDVRKWDQGADINGPATSDAHYSLSNIRRTANIVTCLGPHVAMVHPHITFELSATNRQPSLIMTIDHAWMYNQRKVCPLSQDDRDALGVFLDKAAFPAP